MKTCIKKLPVIIFVLLAIFVFLSTGVFAETPDPPWFEFTGTFEYDVTTHALTTTILTIDKIAYIDGTFSGAESPFCDFNPAFCTGAVTDDPLDPDPGTSGIFILGTPDGSSGVIYNSDTSNMSFGGASDGTGYMDFSVQKDGAEYLAATMTGFDVTRNMVSETLQTQLNPNYDAWHITNILTDTDPTALDSKFINDVESFNNPFGNLFMQFEFSTGTGLNDFTESASGTIFGGRFAVAPEPVSSILFLSGGVMLAFRRYTRTGKSIK